MTAYLIVRAEVPEADRAAFDGWYEAEHLPQAKKAFKAKAAERGWSANDPGVHFAIYHFDDLEAAQSIAQSDEINSLIAEFDRRWRGRVTRSREVVEMVQSL